MIRVNLIPPECLERQRLRTRNMRLAGGAIITAVIFFGITVMHIQAAAAMQKQLETKQKALKGLGVKVTKVTDLETMRNNLKSHLDSLNGLLSERYYYPRFMSDISAKLTPSIWFTSIQTKIKDGGNIEFTCAANALDGDDIAAWLGRLETTPSFSGVTMGPVSVVINAAGEQTFSFTVKGVYTAGAK